MIELRENEAARALLRETEPMSTLKRGDPARYLKLERLLVAPQFDAREIYGDGGREERRQALAKGTSTHSVVFSFSVGGKR